MNPRISSLMRIAFLISLFFLASTCESYAQTDSVDDTQQESLKQWYFQDPITDPYYGISLTKAYATLPSTTPLPVVVAIIDAGIDTNHQDLKGNLWVNTKEIPGNGMDDDHNGYVDDVHGWSFIGGQGGDVAFDNIEITRLYKMGKKGIPAEYNWKKICKAYHKELKAAKRNARLIAKLNTLVNGIAEHSGKKPVPVEEVANYRAHGLIAKLVKKQFVAMMKDGETFESIKKEINEGTFEVQNELKYNLNTEYDARSLVGDNYADVNEKYYGSTNIMGPDPSHGTHIAGIIGAVRNNSIGMDGIAPNVRLMIIRAVPDGDERDKDVANAIYYAVNNGAKIINMSFGKSYSPDVLTVDAAVRFAVSNGVLLVHATGNESVNIDVEPNFPSATYRSDSTKASTWIEVGASNQLGNIASFSNYGAKSVDLLAPGQQMYSTLPENSTGFESGTSMSAPVVSGVAALIWSYFPQLSAEQVKEVLMTSAERRDQLTNMPGNVSEKVPFSKMCNTGGIINAEKAIRLAAKAAAH